MQIDCRRAHLFQIPPIIHRDIKPSNIIITAYNRAVLLDFNAAIYYSCQSTEDTILLGTQGYASPEQYGFGSSSPQTDIYSMGILFRELLNSICYLLISWMCLTIEIKNTYGAKLWVERIDLYSIILSFIFGCFNYLDIQQLMPLCRRKNILIRLFGILLLNTMLAFELLVLMFVIESIFFPA